MKCSTLPALLCCVLYCSHILAQTQSIIIGNSATNSLSAVQLSSAANTFTAPKITSTNDTVFQWWYFSSISQDGQTSIVAIFFTTTPAAFPFAIFPSVTTINIQVFGPNAIPNVLILDAESANFTWGPSLGEGVQSIYSASWIDQARFNIAPALEAASLTVKGTTVDGFTVDGTMSLRSIAPAHYPCTSDESSNQTLAIFPNLGWTNAMPAATADASFDISGFKYEISSGAGYVDMNWGAAPFQDLVQTWYWGRATLGPYSIVLFDGVDSDGNEEVVAYVANNGEILRSTCDTGSVVVRPVGDWSEWPPTPWNNGFDYLTVKIDMGESGILAFKLRKKHQVVAVPFFYHRWIGVASGGLVGGDVYSGPAEWEEFTID